MTDMSPTTGKLLTPSEREICLLIVSQDTAPHSKRAQALLCLDEGITQKESCTITGLALGQLRYALSLFKNSGITMFPPKVLATIEPAPAPKELTQQEEKVPAEAKTSPAPVSDASQKPAAPRQKSFEEMSATISELLEKVDPTLEEEAKAAKKEGKKKSTKKKKSKKEKAEKKDKKKEKSPKSPSDKKPKKKKKEISLKALLEKEKAQKKAKKKEKKEAAEKKGKKKKKKDKK